jgi:hypothetical protein
MEWFAVVVVVLILFGPIAWAVTKGRRSHVPDHEDPQGSTAYGEFIRNVEAPPGQSGPPSGQGS